MRILIVNQYFGGDQTPTGRMAYDVARALRERGHEPVALAGPAEYAGTEADIEAGDVEVVHLPLLPGGRLPRWGSYWAQVAVRINRLEWDRALLLTDPPFLLSAARLFRRHNLARPLTWWTMDLYPEALAARGDLRATSRTYRALETLNEYGLQLVDGVVALGERQRKRLHRYANWPGDDRCLVVPPWDHRPLPSVPRRSNRFLAANGWTDRKIALYAGNLGEAHSFETLVAGARAALESVPEWMFVFVVRGARKAALLAASADLPNVAVLDYVAPDMTADLLWAADVHVITMQPGWEGIVVPSKLYGALATEAPILFVGPRDADTAAEIRRYEAGLQIDAGTSGSAVAGVLNYLSGRTVSARPSTDGPARVAEFVLRNAVSTSRLPLAA